MPINKRTLDLSFAFAAQKGELDKMQSAMEKGADIHAYDDSALRWAIINRHVDAIIFILSNSKQDYKLPKKIPDESQAAIKSWNLKQKLEPTKDAISSSEDGPML